jgi:hypothetical protein
MAFLVVALKAKLLASNLSIREPAIIVRKVVTFPEHEEKINIK